MNTNKPIPRYSHPPLIGAYSYKMTPLLSVTPSKRSNAKPPSLIKTHIQAQKENSNSFSNINKQMNSMKTYVKESHKLLFSNKDKTKVDTSSVMNMNAQGMMMMMMTHPIYTKRKNMKVKNRKISSNDIKSMITLNKNDEYSITYENNNGVNNNITMTNSNSNNKDDGNHISTYMKNVALQQSYVKKRPNNRSFIRMSSTCVGNNASSYFSNGNSNSNSNGAHFIHYFERDWNYHNNNNNNHIVMNNNSSNISYINNGVNTSHLGYNTNNITKLQTHSIQQHNHQHHTTHMPTYIPSSTDDIAEYFTYADEREHELTKEEKEIYGTREMKGYQKLKLLGK